MARGATARLFAAVDPPPEVCEELAEWALEAVADGGSWKARRPRRPHRPPRPLKADALHLTLCFLGSRPVGEIPELISALSPCAEAVGELSVGAPLWLPPRRPHALAVEIHDRAGALAGLHASVAGALARASDWEPERRRFRPHITVVRMRESPMSARGQTGEPPLLPPTPQLRFTPESIVLYRSLSAPGGTTYDALASSFLGPAGP
jgi:RNA 2',3'-cyclic 3'-phosphodiesterase